MQLHQLTSLITIRWPLDYHINKDCEIERGTDHCVVFQQMFACLAGYQEKLECFPGHFVRAFVIWISSEALKAVILMQWCSHSPSRINSKEVLAYWCSGCFSDTVSWERQQALCLQQPFPCKQKVEICALLELTWHSVCESKRTLGE